MAGVAVALCVANPTKFTTVRHFILKWSSRLHDWCKEGRLRKDEQCYVADNPMSGSGIE